MSFKISSGKLQEVTHVHKDFRRPSEVSKIFRIIQESFVSRRALEGLLFDTSRLIIVYVFQRFGWSSFSNRTLAVIYVENNVKRASMSRNLQNIALMTRRPQRLSTWMFTPRGLSRQIRFLKAVESSKHLLNLQELPCLGTFKIQLP